jgi:hypothetical protein
MLCVRGFWLRLGREKLGFCGYGRQPDRPLLLTGLDPGSSETDSILLLQMITSESHDLLDATKREAGSRRQLAQPP